MSRKHDGFTLVEVLVAMIMFVMVIAAASQVFTSVLTQFKQQSKIAETQIEGIIGLEILRQDVRHAGYGLPWVIPASVAYSEASGAGPGAYNDCSGAAPCNPPRAILSGNGSGFNGSDELIVKAMNAATNDTAHNWTHLGKGDVKVNGLSGELFANDDRVIVINPGSSAVTRRTLALDTVTAAFSATYNNTVNFAPTNDAIFLVYGVKPAGVPVSNARMPFNRADFYISTANVPARCAGNTGVLIKSVIQHGTGNRGGGLALVDCVADIQVIFGQDNDGDGDFEPAVPPDGYSDDISLLTAANIRDGIKQVNIYVLAHEGQKDPSFTYNTNPVTVGEFGGGRAFDFAAAGIPEWENYRWRLYILSISPENLR